MESDFVQFPVYETLKAFIHRHGVARLYGHTLKKFTSEISSECHLDNPYSFVPDALYAYEYNDGAYTIRNLSEEYRSDSPTVEAEA